MVIDEELESFFMSAFAHQESWSLGNELDSNEDVEGQGELDQVWDSLLPSVIEHSIADADGLTHPSPSADNVRASKVDPRSNDQPKDVVLIPSMSLE